MLVVGDACAVCRRASSTRCLQIITLDVDAAQTIQPSACTFKNLREQYNDDYSQIETLSGRPFIITHPAADIMQQLNWTIINMTNEIIAQSQHISRKQTGMYTSPVSNDETEINSPPVSNNLTFAHEGNHLVAHIPNRRLGGIMAEPSLLEMVNPPLHPPSAL
jgi:hypothetical protein